MASNQSTKTCRTCFNEIDSRAKKCPHCLSLQGSLRNLLLAGFAILIAIIVGALIWFDFKLDHLQFRGPNHAAKIEILSSELYFTPKQDGESVSIVGELANRGDVVIDKISLEVRIMNQEGLLIDSYDNSFYEHLEPGEEISFKLTSYQNIHLPKEDYANHKVIVRSAKSR